jgi:hypothetical protein
MDQEMLRIDFINAIASKLRGAEPGRTALMKLAYFAQELQGIPLGYNFSLYSYGPFDSSVLSDLDVAQNMTAVDVKVNHHALGYGYQITARQDWKPSKDIQTYSHQIDKITTRFGRLKPSELELLSTLIFVDRSAREKKRQLPFDRLVENTHEIKPHFPISTIKAKAEELANEGLLQLSQGTSTSNVGFAS